MSIIKSSFPEFRDLFRDDFFSSQLINRDDSPSINVIDNEKDYEIELAAPGFQKKDFKITMDNGALTIGAEASHKQEEEAKNYTRREFSRRSFNHSFRLPENVKDEEVSAKYTDGVLRLSLSKKTPAKIQAKKIVIE